jgi:3-hydroxyisobutyrate dehydrogenase-like beta-hydroxyacid dehydrogenase
MIGFIGAGEMGGAMIGTLVKAGFGVCAFDIDPQRLAQAVSSGAAAGGSGPEVLRQCDTVLLSLRSSRVFVRVAEEVLLPNARPGQIFVDLGTTKASQTRRLAREFRQKNACLVDAPVSGGRHGCATGTLHIFVGGDQEAVGRCWSILEKLGKPGRVVYCGPSGSGQVVKGVNQLAMGLADAAYLEAIAYGVRAGVPATAIMQAVGGDDGWRKYFEGLARRVVAGTAETVFYKYPEFPYFLDEARANGFPAPLLTALHGFVRSSPHDAVDNMGRPEPPIWRELMRRHWPGGDLPKDWDE